MNMQFDSKRNYEDSKNKSGYLPREKATREVYDKVGFMSGLEVHQQLLTEEKLFCHCPSGIYNKDDDFDAELIRHMRPTLSELGEYDGTALMEFKTRKEIIYRINNENACTYEIDDTPPFPINREALGIALEISLLSKLNIVGEVHITRKQYLDGSIPAGFQRTAILGVEGELQLPHKKIRLIQLSIEEDACREISDIGHQRVYKTDRLGMPLIETVTYPDCATPDEVKEACDYIRFLNRSTGKVRTGIGAARQDVNVSCKGGTRVEIKGVAHTKWIPELTHNEMFRQWALLQIKKQLSKKIKDTASWKVNTVEVVSGTLQKKDLLPKSNKIVAINLPGFKGILSHFTQPGKMFANELSDRLKVIACLEKPNMIHSEEFDPMVDEATWDKIKIQLKAGNDDAQLIIWGNKADIPTAIETVEERCKMAFDGVPPETRKSLEDGTTIFERVLPGADRMYPDTDSAPIPLKNEYIEELSKNLPSDIVERYKQLKKWHVSEDTYTYIFSKNLFPLMERIINELNVSPRFLGNFLGHRLKFALGHYQPSGEFKFTMLYPLFKFLKDSGLREELAFRMIPELVQHPKMEFESILNAIKFKRYTMDEITDKIPTLIDKFAEGKWMISETDLINFVMGQLRNMALGNVDMKELSDAITGPRFFDE
ncbi:MAG: Glu-tRNA(Gln) amidotransferase GatDE subunit E [Bacteroidetes bacterium]|nr:MAG: Glu-tRNA(Gln) amidotransferase GatDE subunit E [Bacteroidota bacterium]